MFQDGSGGGPTDSPLTRSAPRIPADKPTQSERTASSASPVERRQRAGCDGTRPNPRPRNESTSSIYNSFPPMAGRSPSRRACDRSEAGRGALPGESALADDGRTAGRVFYGSQSQPSTARTRQVEFPGPTLRIHPFASKRFHVLLNSLFKVLFNFPSRYLSAIGLVPVFSLRWSLPPSLGCILKQPDSRDAHSHDAECL